MKAAPEVWTADSILAAIVAEWESGRTGWRDDYDRRIDDLSDHVEKARAYLIDSGQMTDSERRT